MDVKRYLEEGKGLEDSASPAPWYSALTRELSDLWDERPYRAVVANSCEIFATPTNEAIDSANADFISDARERLPKYRKALERVLIEIDAFESGHEWDSAVDISQPAPIAGFETIRWSYALIRKIIEECFNAEGIRG
jgi:hypothetical protein